MAKNPSRSVAYKTAVFRVHNPSRRKRAMLHDALTRNHLAYSKLLAQLLPRLEEFAQLKRGIPREGAISKAAWPMVRPLPLSGAAKAGLLSDVAGQLSSHIELRQAQETPSVPTAARLNATAADYGTTLAQLAAACTVEQENTGRDHLFSEVKAGTLRPLLFVKNRVADGYLLLWSPEKSRYYAWLNLHSRESRFADRVEVHELIDVRTGEVVSFKSETGALFPLELGRDFHDHEFLQKGRPQSAKLVERAGAYEIHVTFEYEAPKLQPTLFLGIDRGIYNLASLSAINDTGAVVEELNVDGRNLRHVQRMEERRQRNFQRRGRRYSSRSRRAMADEAVHTAANKIVELSARLSAQVVVENLTPLTHRGRKRGRSNFNRVLNRSQYQKLEQVLSYKLAVVGLPKPVAVSAAYTSQTCPQCAYQHRENRPKRAVGDGFEMDRFICQQCGYQADADLNASRVIALKRIWRERLPQHLRPKLMSEIPDQHNFAAFLRDRAAMRGDRPGDRQVSTPGGGGLDTAGPNTSGNGG